MAMLLNGKEAAAGLNERLAVYARLLRSAGAIPTLAVLRVGEREEALLMERGVMGLCRLLGVETRQAVLPGQCGQAQLMAAVEALNRDPAVHGCLLLRPLPSHLDERAACECIAPEKDVDGVTPGSMAALFSGRGPGYPPCAAEACLAVLDHYHCDLEGQRVTVVGPGLSLGRPLAMLLLGRSATVTLCHTRTHDLPGECRRADVLVAAVGKAGFIDRGYVSHGQIILDTGVHKTGTGLLRGDVDFASVEPMAGAITPVPGGIGAVTASILARHVLLAAAKVSGVELGESCM